MVIKSKSHKIQVSDMFREDQLKFLTRKINPNVPHLESRAAILEHLVDQAMENPKLLDV